MRSAKKTLIGLLLLLSLAVAAPVSYAAPAADPVPDAAVQTAEEEGLLFEETGRLFDEEAEAEPESEAEPEAAEEETGTEAEASLFLQEEKAAGPKAEQTRTTTGITQNDRASMTAASAKKAKKTKKTKKTKKIKKKTTKETLHNGFSTAQAPSLSNSVNGVAISWKKVKKAESYRVYRRNAGKTKWNKLTDTAQTRYVDRGAKSGTVYEYLILPYKTVKGIKKFGGYNAQSSKAVRCLSAPVLKAVTSEKKGLSFHWKKVSGASSYHIYRRAKAGGSWKLIGKTTKRSYLDTGVKTAKGYEYTVSAWRGSACSAKASAALTGVYLPQPRKLKAIASSGGTVITWKAVDHAAGYKVYRRTQEETAWTRIARLTDTRFTDRKYEAGTTYYYTVCAYHEEAIGCCSEFDAVGKKARAQKLDYTYRKDGKTYMYLDGYLGISREDLLAQLGKHETDLYYRGTPPRTGDNRSAYGDPYHTYGASDSYGSAGFNCTGFVWRALYDSGANPKKIPLLRGASNCWQNPKRNGNNTWNRFIQGDDGTIPVHYRFSSVQELLKSGKAEKGDIIYCRQTGQPSPITGIVDSHVGIFYGDTPSDNKFFHCGPLTFYGGRSACGISEINPGSPSTIFLVKWLPAS